MNSATVPSSTSQLTDPRETDLVRSQMYEELVQGAWQAADGQQKQLETMSKLLKLERENNQRYEQVIAELEQKNPNALLPNKRKEVIAVLNAFYELFCSKSCSKQEFFQRQAAALGDEGLAAYSTPLSQIRQATKYESVFDDLTATALAYRESCDEA